MSYTYSRDASDARSEVKRTVEIEAGGAATESMGGIAVLALAILALAGVMPAALSAVAGVVFGAAILMEGGAVAAKHRSLSALLGQADETRLRLGGGASTEVVVGIAAIALGVLALVGIAAHVMLASLVIVGGAGLIMSAGTLHELSAFAAEVNQYQGGDRPVARSAVASAMGGQVLFGLGAMTLGVLALIPGVGAGHILVEVGLLVLGAAIVLSGSAISGRLLGVLSRRRF